MFPVFLVFLMFTVSFLGYEREYVLCNIKGIFKSAKLAFSFQISTLKTHTFMSRTIF
jgi:hypothetical protein